MEIWSACKFAVLFAVSMGKKDALAAPIVLTPLLATSRCPLLSAHRASAEMKTTPGKYSSTGPRCILTQVDGIREGRCLDGHSTGIEPGGKVRVFPCVKRWPQFVSFGNGTLAPKGSMHTNVPRHIVDRINESRPDDEPQESYLCLGVLGRGEKDEEHLYEVEDDAHNGEDEIIVKEYDDEEFGSDGFLKLDHFQGEEIVATRCSNVGAVVEWLFVPFIVEENESEFPDESTVEDASDETDQAGTTADAQAQQPTCSSDSCYDESVDSYAAATAASLNS